jgi:tetratricopeptide (TPR) repeat protein
MASRDRSVVVYAWQELLKEEQKMTSLTSYCWALTLNLLLLFPLVGWLDAAETSSRRKSPTRPSTSSGSELSITVPDEPPATQPEEPDATVPDATEPATIQPEESEAQEPGVLDAAVEAETAELPKARSQDNPHRVITPLPEQADPPRDEQAKPDSDAPPISATVLQPAPSEISQSVLPYRDLVPGVTTKKELIQAWGAPTEVGKAHGVINYSYRPKDQRRTKLTLTEGVVTTIVIQIDEPMDPEIMAKELGIEKISSVEVADEDGQILGEAFPERGALFAYVASSKPPLVSQVILEPLDAQPFLLRAEAELETDFGHCLADANSALELDPKSAAAQAMRARVYRQAGDLNAALQAAQEAVALEPSAAEWHLVLAKILIQLSDFPRAAEQLELILQKKSSDPLASAGAHLLLGEALALASNQNHAAAIKEHQECIRLARSLDDDPRARRRRKAAELIIDAHLRVAYSIGWGYFQHKDQAVEKWLSGAQKLADELVSQGVLRPDVQVRVSEQALAALAGLTDPPDPTRWERAALDGAKELFDEATEPARAAQIQWQLGLALCDAMQIEQTRRAYGRALEFGRLAAEHLEQADVIGRQLPDHDFMIGQLFYRIGAIHAVGRKDHKQALNYYGRAVKLLEAPVPSSRTTDPGRHGETFVSIAVSYWETGQQEEAMRLTSQGVKLMEQAVEDGLLSKAALAIPYANLSNMYSEMGDARRASEFSALAAKFQRDKQ